MGARREERREQGTLGAQSNLEIVLTHKRRQEREREQEVRSAQPRRTARPGKPLKR